MKLFISITFFFIHNVFAQTLEINLSEKYTVNDYLQYTLAQTPDEAVEDLEGRAWFKDKHSFNTLQYSNHAYWAKLKVKNLANSSRTYYFKAENQFTYLIEYYLIKNNKIVKYLKDGVISKNHHRAFNANHMLFTLEMQAHSEAEVYFKIRNYNKVNINFLLVTQDYLLDFYQTYNLLEGIFFGGMILMMLYNLFLYIIFRIRSYIYYVAYAFGLTVYFIGLFGFSERYFASSTYIFYISSGVFFTFLTLFVQSILNLKKKLPQINKLLNLYIAYFLLSTIINSYMLEIELFVYAQILFNLFFIVLFTFSLIIIGSTYYLAYFKQDKIAKFYSIIWSLLAAMGILLPLQYLNIIQLAIPADYIFQFLTLIEILFFSFLLAHNINLIEAEKQEQKHILIQQNKLASMGEVISMIAHQWRQPLSEVNGIILNMDIDYRKEKLSTHKFNHYLDNLESITAYMSDTINNFLDYFKHNQEKETFKLSQLIEGTINLASSSNKKDVNITYVKHPEISLNAYRSQLIQALLIVINNAIDACTIQNSPKKSKILISVTMTNRYIVITIEDNGGGIPVEIIDKIYDPYFTTKHQSKGTGLGLYILKMIIEQNMQGKITITSANKKTICNIHIPISTEKKIF